jgi:hypothetical protein
VQRGACIQQAWASSCEAREGRLVYVRSRHAHFCPVNGVEWVLDASAAVEVGNFNSRNASTADMSAGQSDTPGASEGKLIEFTAFDRKVRSLARPGDGCFCTERVNPLLPACRRAVILGRCLTGFNFTK